MKVFFIIALLGISAQAMAAAELVMDPNQTPFQQLSNNFNQGTLPTVESVKGWWTGRCYEGKNPSVPLADLLVVEPTTVVTNPGNPADGGPLFPSVPPTNGTVWVMGHVIYQAANTPNIFDALTDDIANQIQGIITSTFGSNFSVTTENNSLVSAGAASVGYKYTLRQYQQYLVGSLISSSTTSGYAVGEVVQACYFFKKVHE